MKKYIDILLLLFVFAVSVPCATAQYYDWGQEPASVKWNQVKTPDGRYVFPRYYDKQAARLINYMDAVRPYAGHGFTYGPMNMPMVMHTQNFISNALVMLAPKRMEFILTPPAAIAAMPWDKQLAVHEFRHSVQYNNLNRGVVRALSYVLGQQGSLLGAGLLPYWFLEGDAVLAETQMSAYGRGLQPSFTMYYRAFCLEDMEFSRDQYVSGTFRYPMPSQYELGYQIVSYADTKYGHNIWDKVARYASRNPYVFFTNHYGLKKHYGTTPRELFDETFGDLWSFWRSQPQVEDSSTPVGVAGKTFTTYASPVGLPDGSVLAFKEDLQRANRIVAVDPVSGRETVLAHTGSVGSPVTVAGGMAYWTEYRQSTFWAQRVNSQLCRYDFATGRKGVVPGERRVTYPVAMDDGSYAAVDYDYTGVYSIKHGGWRVEMPDTVSVHGLAYDRLTDAFYFIGLSDAGMWIGSVSENSPVRKITELNRSSIANLRAGDGKLYYNSIATGKDEAHMYDLAERKEYAVTESKYGSFSPAPVDGGVVLTTFSRDGYRLAVQGDDVARREVAWSELPRNTVNPPRRKWDDVINIDAVTVPDTTGYGTRKYRKGLNLVQVHSWAPFYFEPDELVADDEFNFGVGATLLSQNLLNSTFSQLGYKYSKDEHYVRGKVGYYGWAPKFEVTAEWSSRDQWDYRSGLAEYDMGYRPKDRFSVTGLVYLPITLSSGYHLRYLTPSLEVEHRNARVISDGISFEDGVPVADAEKLKFKSGLQEITARVQFSDNVRMAYRDIFPRWGYMAGIKGLGNPFSDIYSNLMEVYGRVYTPGLAPHHSFRLRGSLQQRFGKGIYGFRSDGMFPRGADHDKLNPNKFSAFSADYQLPLGYPDWGIPAVLYVTRIRLNMGFDMAFWKKDLRPAGGKVKSGRVWSYGGDIIFDAVPISLPFHSQGSLRVSIYKPSDSGGVEFGVGLSLPL